MADILSFTDFHVPALADGEYPVTARIVLTDGGEALPFPTGANLLSLHLKVEGTRFRLAPDQVYSCYPPVGGTGDYAGALPSVAFTQTTLPWERQAAPEAHDFPHPWLAIVTVPVTEDIAPLTTTLGELRKRTQRFGAGTEDNSLPLMVLPLAHPVRLLPRWKDLTYSACVRASSLTGEVSALMGNRLPATGMNTAYLVSVENLYTGEYNAIQKDTNNNADGTTWLPVLYAWSFECTDPNTESSNRLRNVSSGMFQLPIFPAQTTHSQVIANRWLSRGYVMLPQQFRNGQSSAAWYKGPFLPEPIFRYGARPLPVLHADALLALDSSSGMLDISCAAAWEIGRQLTLQNSHAAYAQYRWKKKRLLARQALQQLRDHPDMQSLPMMKPLKRLLALQQSLLAFFRLDYDDPTNEWPNKSTLPDNPVAHAYIHPEGDLQFQLDDAFGISVALGGGPSMAPSDENLNQSMVINGLNISVLGGLAFSCWFFPVRETGDYLLFTLRLTSNLFVTISHGAFLVMLDSIELFYGGNVRIHPNRWNHLALVIQEGKVTLYVDAVVAGSFLLHPHGEDGNDTLLDVVYIGGDRLSSFDYFSGLVANARIYGTALASDDLAIVMEEDREGREMYPWLNSLQLLKGVPFQYLVPDERMLPPESARMFLVDTDWMKSLLDGAFSMARTTESEQAADADWFREAGPTGFPNQYGMLIRSAAIGNLKHLEFQGYFDPATGNEPMSPLRKATVLRCERLSDDCVLVLFDKPVFTVDIRMPPAALHYGFATSVDNNGQLILQKTVRNGDGTTTTNPPYPLDTTSDSPDYDPVTRVIRFNHLVDHLFGEGSACKSGYFAMQMLETSVSVRFVAVI